MAVNFLGFHMNHFLPILRDDNFKFLSEEELPEDYKAGKLLF